MTFDEAIDLINEISYDEATDVWFEKEDLFSLINDLREEYAPTVELTSGEKATILDEKEGISLSWVLTDSRSFDAMYWGNRSERDIAQAWLHPETIKVVDE